MHEHLPMPSREPLEAELPARRERGGEPARVDEVWRAYPRTLPPALPHRGPESEGARYALPFLLVGLVGLILLFSYLSVERPVDLAPSAIATPQLSNDHRLLEAEKLVRRGDQLWTEGYRGWNDKTLLAESAQQYREAWLLLTGQEWGRVSPSARAAVAPLQDSSKARLLTEKVRARLAQLEKTLR